MSTKSDWRKQRAPANILLIPRVFLAALFITRGWDKVARDESRTPFDQGMVGFLNSQQFTHDWYRAFLEQIVLPNPGLFGFLVSWGELLVGIALLFGVLLPVAAFIGAFMALNYTFAFGRPITLPGFEALIVYCSACLILARSGRDWGIDYWLHRRFGNRWFW